MSAIGNLSVTARYADGALSEFSVDLSRPPVVRLFIGQLPEAVHKTIPYLYTLCAQAQRAAATAALAGARGLAQPDVDHDALWREALHEHLWRLLLDWPPALGLPAARSAFTAWRTTRGTPDFLSATEALLDATLRGELAAQCRARLGDESATAHTPFPLNPDAWLAHWTGEDAELPLPPAPPSVAAAWAARRHEALDAVAALREGRPYPLACAGDTGRGHGVGLTMTARGLLVHAARLEQGKVAAYRVWAPTDVHFAGPDDLAALLSGRRWQGPGEARRALEQAVLALDPCLPYTVSVDNA